MPLTKLRSDREQAGFARLLKAWFTTKVKISRPLFQRDFGLFWAAYSVSLIGDGVYLVAVIWQTFQLWNSPAALGFVGLAMTLPPMVLGVAGGLLVDRFERRLVLILTLLMQGSLIAMLGLLSISRTLSYPLLVVMLTLYYSASAVSVPAFAAIVPELTPKSLLVEANSLISFIRPMAWYTVGPAIGGVVVATAGSGTAFLIDALSFVVPAAVLLIVRPRTARRAPETLAHDLVVSLRYIGSQPWLWTGILAGGFILLSIWGPYRVLLPYLLKNRLGGGPLELSAVLIAAGVGSMFASLAIGQRGLPIRSVSVLFSTWAIGALLIAGFGLVGSWWQAVPIAFAAFALLTTGNVLWGTLLQALVPLQQLGRVASLDRLVQNGLAAVSFALTAPVANALGADVTLIAGGLIAGPVGLSLLLWLRASGQASRTEVEVRTETAIGGQSIVSE